MENLFDKLQKANLIVDVPNLEDLIKNEWWLNADDFVNIFWRQLN